MALVSSHSPALQADSDSWIPTELRGSSQAGTLNRVQAFGGYIRTHYA